MKTVRWSEVLKKTGTPKIHLLLMEVKKDAEFQKALESQRIMTLHQPTESNRTDYGEVGYHAGKNGQFIITLDPTQGEAYQGIVPIEGESVAEMLQNYMLRSQQIDTSLWLHCDETSASGLLLQKLPDFGGSLGGVSSDNVAPVHNQDEDAWNRMNHLANTITNDELQNLSAETLLTRLFVEENVRLFEPKPTQFHCSCNQNSVASMLRMLGEEELNSILAEFGKIEVNCDFCNKHYLFDAVDTAQLLVTEAAVSISKAKH